MLSSLSDYQRYAPQLILPSVGLPGQRALQNASVVVVGAGGLGCPALQYLAAAGIGTIAIVDHDHVELSNLQRQILHSEATLGVPKAQSAAAALRRINAAIRIHPTVDRLTPANALALLSPYDVILDCTDNIPTRYLINDAAVALGKPLVSGAAQKLEGQLAVFNRLPDGPCYRCLYPTPPPTEALGSCAELGVLGVVTGIIGNMQALETIKLILGHADPNPSLLLFSALSFPPFRSVKLRSRKSTCISCSDPSNSLKNLESTDYVQFCGGPTPNWVERGLQAGDSRRAKPETLKELIASGSSPTIIDVRPPTEFGICQLPGSQNVPLKELLKNPEKYVPKNPDGIYVVCRLGNDSQIAVEALTKARGEDNGTDVWDVIGGLRAWSQKVDPDFPIY